MLYTVVNLDDVFGLKKRLPKNSFGRSTNPYDYIRKGWFLDNSVMYKGVKNVNLNFDYSGDFTGGV